MVTLEYFSAISTAFYTRPRLGRTGRWFSSNESMTGWLCLCHLLLNQLLCYSGEVYTPCLPDMDAHLLKILDFQDAKA